MEICAFIQMFNEATLGNLVRCLENVRQWADNIVIYDDASTDNSVEIARRYTPYIIEGKKNCINEELFHKQQLLELALTLKPDWIMWIDCDEILDRKATEGGLRKLADQAPLGVNAYRFHQVNLWRSQTYARTDSLFDVGWFCRLWRVTTDIRFETEKGVHLRLWPISINEETIVKTHYNVIHYGFSDYQKMLVKIGAHWCDKKDLHKISPANWILNETKCFCYKLPEELFPEENVPPDVWLEPKPKPITDLVPHSELETPSLLLEVLGDQSKEWWEKQHKEDYHGNYESILQRNQCSYKAGQDINRLSSFKFNPKDKIILDIGCGGGWYALECIANGAKKVYCLEASRTLVDFAKKSFEELQIQKDKYEFVCLPEEPKILANSVDIIYSMAVFMHIPLCEVRAYLHWIKFLLKNDGEAHLQFHQKNEQTLFGSDGHNPGYTIPDSSLDSILMETGLQIKNKEYPRAEKLEPVWTFYVCETSKKAKAK